MDDQIAKLLCDKCRPLLEAALRYERAELERKKARQDLRALTQGRVSGGGGGGGGASDDDDVDMVTALASTKQKLGGSAVHANGKPTTQKSNARAMAKRRKTSGIEIERRLSTPAAQQDLVRVIRGDFPLAELAVYLGVSASSCHRKLAKLIGEKKPSDPMWVQGYGYRRRGKRAYDVLVHKAGKGWKEPSMRSAPSGERYPKDMDVGVDNNENTPPPRATQRPFYGKRGRPGPNDPPKPTISAADLEALANGKATAYQLRRKYQVSNNYVQQQLALFRVRYGADLTDAGVSAQGSGDSSASADPSDRPDPADIVAHVLRN